MTNPNNASKQARTWGMILTGVGGVFLLAGLLMWLLMIGTTTISDGESDLVSNIVFGGLCCFGPPALLGGILAVVGGVLWYTNREAEA